MATELIFQTKFVKPLAECYGQIKFPPIRVQRIWDKLKALPDHIVGQCADRIILNFDAFPGVQNILNTCGEVAGEYVRAEAERLKASINCHRCASQGVILANNYAYKCTCQLGELLYPYYPLYQGQVHIPDKISIDEEGNRVFEDAHYKTTVAPGCKNIRQVRTILKSEAQVLAKKEAPKSFQTLSFKDFTKGDA